MAGIRVDTLEAEPGVATVVASAFAYRDFNAVGATIARDGSEYRSAVRRQTIRSSSLELGLRSTRIRGEDRTVV